MKKLKTINIKEKPYVEVNERIKHFRSSPQYKGWSLSTKIIFQSETEVWMKATVCDDKGKKVATGHAYEDKRNGFINKTSHVENCETSAWGRALANLGIGIDSQVASYEEVANARLNQPNKDKNTPPPRKVIHLMVEDANWANVLGYIGQQKKNGKDIETIIQALKEGYNITSSVKELLTRHYTKK
jgi:hypothetical protein